MFIDEELYADNSLRNKMKQMENATPRPDTLIPSMSEWDKWSSKRIKSFSSFYIKVIQNKRKHINHIE